MTFLIILIACLLPVAAYLIMKRKRSELERRTEKAMASGLSAWSKQFVDVAGEAGTVKLTGEQLDAIDTGLQFTFDKAKKLGWTRGMKHDLYTVVILKGELYKDINVVRLPNGDYVAGICVDLDNMVMAIPEHRPEQLEELAQIVGYEAEHLILFRNDRAEYERTKIHQGECGHPLF